MAVAKITTKGQVTLPKDIRDALGLHSGDRVRFDVQRDGTVVMTAQKRDVMELFGAVKPKVQGVSLEDMEAAIGRGATE